jgi:hypothetical protein
MKKEERKERDEEIEKWVVEQGLVLRGSRRSFDDYGKRWERRDDHVIILFLSDFSILDTIKG